MPDFSWSEGSGGWTSTPMAGDDSGSSWLPAETTLANQNLANYLGYTGSFGQYVDTGPRGLGEGQEPTQTWQTDPNWQFLLDKGGYSLKHMAQGPNMLQQWFDKGNNPTNIYGYGDWHGDDPLFGALVNLGVGAVTGGALGGGGFAGGLGVSNAAAAGALNSGLAGGMVAGGSDGNILQGMLQGAIGGGLGGTISQINPAGSLGIENKTLASMFNKGVGNTIGTLASTQDPRAAITSGLSGAATTGLNAMGGNFFKSLFSGGEDLPALNDNPAMNASYADYTPNGVGALRQAGLAPEMSYPTPNSNMFDLGSFMNVGMPTLSENPAQNASYPEGWKPNGVSVLEQSGLRPEMSYAPGQETMPFLRNFTADAGIQSAAPASSGMADFGGKLGNFALNNAGDLVTMLYGMYNNRKQRGALQNQINGLQGLYGQNSPYAQQLRGKLQAQAAAKGTRLNTAGRETQLQAELANRAASLAPSLYQMQQGANTLQNTNIGNALNMFNKMGGWKALSDLFKG